MGLLAVNQLEADFMRRLNVYMTVGLTLIAICVLVWLVLRIRTWFVESEDSDEPYQDMLTGFHQLKREGDLSAEEYEKISQKLSASKAAISDAKPNSKPLSNKASAAADQAKDQSTDKK